MSRARHRHDHAAFQDTESACTWRQERGKLAGILEQPVKPYEPNRWETLGHPRRRDLFTHLNSGLEDGRWTYRVRKERNTGVEIAKSRVSTVKDNLSLEPLFFA